MKYQYFSNSSTPTALVFLHGWLCSSDDFFFQLEYFKKKYSILIPDYSDLFINDKFPFDCKDYLSWIVSQIKNILNEKNINDIVLVGHSAGGTIGLLLAAQLHERVRTLVIIDTTMPEHGKNREFCNTFRQLDVNDALDILSNLISSRYINETYDNLALMFEKRQKMLDTFCFQPQKWIELLSELAETNERTLDLIKKCKNPIFYIGGANPLGNIQELETVIPKSHIFQLLSGHFIMLNQPIQFNEIFRKILVSSH